MYLGPFRGQLENVLGHVRGILGAKLGLTSVLRHLLGLGLPQVVSLGPKVTILGCMLDPQIMSKSMPTKTMFFDHWFVRVGCI